MAKNPKNPKIEYEAEDAYDVPVDTVFELDGRGNPVAVEVKDDAENDQAQ